MNIRPVGGIFWRLDANGNLTAYDTGGNVIAKFLGGSLSTKGNILQVSDAILRSTTSLTLVSTGVGGSFTPQISTRAFVSLTIAMSVSSVADEPAAAMFFTTGAIPAAGTGATGTQIVPALVATFSLTAATGQSATLTGVWIVTGLTTGTAYNFYAAYEHFTGGVGTDTMYEGAVFITVEEL